MNPEGQNKWNSVLKADREMSQTYARHAFHSS